MECHAKGKHGWDSPRLTKEYLRIRLLKTIEDEDFIDAANYLMFLWNRQEPEL